MYSVIKWHTAQDHVLASFDDNIYAVNFCLHNYNLILQLSLIQVFQKKKVRGVTPSYAKAHFKGFQ